MMFVYLDDFGHVGPYFERAHPKFNTSPVYGFAGFALPEEQVRPFSSFFLQLKQYVCANDLRVAQEEAARWEKKGTNLFTRKAVEKYVNVREAGFRLIYEIRMRGGFIFYHGREKVRGRCDLHPNGLKTTVLSHTIRKIDTICTRHKTRFAIVLDQDEAKVQLLTAAQKTMFGSRPCRALVCPPFEVESHLDQNMQAADWVASIVGKLWSQRLDPIGFADCEIYNKYYWERLHRVAHGSSVDKSERIRTMPHGMVARRVEATTVITETLEVFEPAYSKVCS